MRMINKGFTECPYNKDQLDKLFDLEKLGKITNAKSFFFDCNETKECKKVMTEMAEAINMVFYGDIVRWCAASVPSLTANDQAELWRL